MGYLKFFSFLIIVGLFAAGGAYVLDRHVPDRLNPMEPVAIGEEPSFLTDMKLMRLKMDAGQCREVLAASELDYRLLPDRETGERCGFENVVLLERSTISYGGDVTLKCPALVALTIWERHDLAALAEEHFGDEVVRIRHYGTYACRNIYGSSTGRRSQHAYANAIDIAGFTLSDGTEISVLDDWGTDTDKGRFLTDLRDAACGRFSTVLGPDYNAAHANHFHFDMGAFSICR